MTTCFSDFKADSSWTVLPASRTVRRHHSRWAGWFRGNYAELSVTVPILLPDTITEAPMTGSIYSNRIMTFFRCFLVYL